MLSSALVLSATTILPVLVVAGFGIYFRHRGLLSATFLQELSRLSYHLLIPSLVFINIVTSLGSGVAGLWALPVVSVIHILVGLLLGYLLILIFKPPLHSHR